MTHRYKRVQRNPDCIFAPPDGWPGKWQNSFFI
jgi:hypothetical protein